MKLHHVLIPALGLVLLSACSFTLAADVTPPPDYVPPTPMPTLGPLFPASAPDVSNGAKIFVEKCAPCHGASGMGDGAQGKQLPVPVPAFALPETARDASPAAWFTMVSQGNLDRFMPPFTSLTEQERWDVVAYALTLHTSSQQLQNGQSLFDANCADCASKFSEQKTMAALTENDLVRIIRGGQGAIPAFGSKFSNDESFAVAAYLRTLTFAPPATPVPVAATAAGSTPVAAATEAQVTTEANAVGSVISGSIENHTGAALPPDAKITLRGYDHGSQSNATPQEVATFEGTINADGTYRFENVDAPANRIYRAEIALDGITYQSEFLVVQSGTTEFSLAPIKVYASSEDYSLLHLNALQIYFDFANEQNVQMLAVYSFSNSSDKTVLVKLDASQQIPFIKMPSNAAGVGYEASPDSASFIQLDHGFAMPPNDKSYGLVAFATLPKQNTIDVQQPLALPVDQVMLLVPEGVSASGKSLTAAGPHQFQGGTFNLYTSGEVEADKSLSFTLSGSPTKSSVNPDITQNRGLLIAVGALGLLLIIAGVWMYRRERLLARAGADQESEDSDSVMDAIIVLDDLHRAGKLSDTAYQKRRAELKSKLKRDSD